MPIATSILDAVARAYVQSMTSIRGRRIHRLLLREFARFDHVLPATAADGSPALLALTEGGAAAVCASDGRGATATIAQWARLDGATVTLAWDLLRDSLPVVSWTIWHPSFDRGPGTLTILAADVPPAEHDRVAAAFRSV